MLVLSFPAKSQISIEGMFRPRTEFRNGYRQLRTPATEPSFFISQRTRLKAGYKSKKYGLSISAQDVRVWGEVEQLQDNANINVHEVYGELFFYPKLTLRAGRQELVYDNHRLLGNVNWTQQGRSHDALRLRFKDEDTELSADVGLAYNQEGENILNNDFTLNNYKTLAYFWLHKTYGAFQFSALTLSDGFQTQPDLIKFRYTYGTQINYSTGSLLLTGEAYGQSGDDANRNDISAYMWAFSTNYRWQNFQLTVGYDYLSGGGAEDKNPQRKSFNTLYATNHKFYGTMDYFLNIPADTRNGGLQDLYLSARYNFSDLMDIKLDIHHFALEDNIQSPNNPARILDKRLGLEFDNHFSYRFAEDVSIQFGYSLLLPNSALEIIQNKTDARDIQHWGWAMLVVTPKFMK